MAVLTINNAYCGGVCFGFLYNRYTVDDVRELTSANEWTVPTQAQYNALTSYIEADGYIGISGTALKIGSTAYWEDDDGVDAYEFGARGSGARSNTGVFQSFKTYGSLWTNTDSGISGVRFGIYTTSISTSTNTTPVGKNNGYGIRIVKDATGIPDGTTTTYTGNDGKTYNAVCINELYWLTENLEETKYRNGDYIQGYSASGYIPIDNTTWAGLSTGVLCLYDDNLDYACKGAILGTTTTIIPVTTTTTTI